MKLFIFDPKKSKNVLCGEYDEITKTFTKKVKKNHFFIKFHGYGIQEEILNQLNQLGCRTICIKTKKSTFFSQLEDWLKQPSYDFGHGLQRFCKC
jgi:carbamoylphosphate synthase small subunit